MDKQDRAIIAHISSTLDEVLKVLKKPENKWLRVMEIAGGGVTILSLLSIVDVIKNWLFGG